MLEIKGHKELSLAHCDGYSRRSFIKAGGMAMGGLSLAQLLQLEATSGKGRQHKAVINVFLPGGPSHIDTFDLKPHASSEFRGEFNPPPPTWRGCKSVNSFQDWPK